MPVEALVFLTAFGLDAVLGDPRWLPHPVVLIGKGISGLEKCLRVVFKSPQGLRGAGFILVLTIVGLSYGGAKLMVWGLGSVYPYLGFIAAAYILYVSIAAHDLARAGMEIHGLLRRGDVPAARRKLSWIVGRDTEHLDEAEIARAAVETVAEGIVDGVISPLFYFVLGGPALAFAYRAVNTMDSMVGYRNDKYRDLGMAAARLDDVANYIPARITGLLMITVFLFTGRPVSRVWKTIGNDAPKHPSPNSGIPEAAMAGGLGIRLGGYNRYGGAESFRAYMGEAVKPLRYQHIKEAVWVMYLVSVLAVAAGTAVICIIA